MNISDIVIGERVRRDMGDLRALADSIAAEGLLQPIGVTGSGELVFGERRLRACQLLDWTVIDAKVVNVSSIAAGEYAENEIRKDFTVSERVAISDAVKHEIGRPHGRPEKNAALQSFPSQRHVDAEAARRSGLGSPRTMHHAKKVVREGAPELVNAMDSGVVSIYAASAVADLPKDEQVRVVEAGTAAVVRSATRKLSTSQGKTNTVSVTSGRLRQYKGKPVNEQRENAVHVIGQMANLLEAVEDRALPTDGRLTEWREILDAALPVLKRFHRHLESAA